MLQSDVLHGCLTLLAVQLSTLTLQLSDIKQTHMYKWNNQHSSYHKHTLLKIKVLHDAIEEPFCLNGSRKNLYHLKNLSVSQKVICGERRFFRLLKGKKEMFFKEPLTEWFFVEPKMVLLWHRLKNLYFYEYNWRTRSSLKIIVLDNNTCQPCIFTPLSRTWKDNLGSVNVNVWMGHSGRNGMIRKLCC